MGCIALRMLYSWQYSGLFFPPQNFKNFKKKSKKFPAARIISYQLGVEFDQEGLHFCTLYGHNFPEKVLLRSPEQSGCWTGNSSSHLFSAAAWPLSGALSHLTSPLGISTLLYAARYCCCCLHFTLFVNTEKSEAFGAGEQKDRKKTGQKTPTEDERSKGQLFPLPHWSWFCC